MLACKPLMLERSKMTDDEEESAAYRILAHALEEPIRVLLQNAGLEPPCILNDLAAAGPGCGYDTLHQRIVNMVEAGIVDSASVVAEAVSRAVRGAALALTVDVLVHRSKPSLAYHTT